MIESLGPRYRAKARLPLGRNLLAAAAMLCLIATSAGPAFCQESTRFRVGPIVQKNAVLQPGIEITYSDPSLLPRQLRFSLAYMTTRAAAAFGSHGLIEDRVLLGGSWHLRPRRILKPFAKLEAGYTRFSREDEEIFALLDNDAFVASVLLGIDVQLRGTRFSLKGDAGYSIIHSSTIYPFVTSLGVFYSL